MDFGKIGYFIQDICLNNLQCFSYVDAFGEMQRHLLPGNVSKNTDIANKDKQYSSVFQIKLIKPQ